MNRFFNWDFPVSREMFRDGRWFPRVDISDTGKKIRVRVELPKVDVEDIDISLDGRLLTIKSEKKREKEDY